METEAYAVAIRISIPSPEVIKLFSCSIHLFIQVSKKAKIRKRYNQVHLTQDTTLESDKNTRKYHIQESQEVSPFTAGSHKAAKKRQESIQTRNMNNKKGSTKEAPPGPKQHHLDKRSTALVRSIKSSLEGLN